MSIEITSIRYINMDKNWHRNLFMKLLLRQVPYNILRCPGVKFTGGNNAHDKYLKNGFNPYLELEDKDRINGVIGCWIAHSLALEDVSEHNGITVVLEDDFVCRSDFFEKALRMVNSFDRDFDIIVFDTWGTGPFETDKIAENIYSPRYHSHPYYGGTHCLFVNNARISKILEAKLNFPVMDYDGFILGPSKLDTYIFYTGGSTSRGIGSDITRKNKLKYDLLSVLLWLFPYPLRERTAKFKHFFSELVEIKKKDFLSEQVLKGFEGYYEFKEQGEIYIGFIVKDYQLELSQPWSGQKVLFQPVSQVEFISNGSPFFLKFTKDKNGNVTHVMIDSQHLFQKINNYSELRRIDIAL